jgi:hypothetical protein
MATGVTGTSAVPCAAAAFAAGDEPPSNWMMLTSRQCFLK